MARIRQSDVDEVKARINIGDVIGERVALKSAGVGSLKGLCPFHDERSPSFHVRPQVGYYHCFGCGESGDVYSFLRAMDHVSFTEAVVDAALTLRHESRGRQLLIAESLGAHRVAQVVPALRRVPHAEVRRGAGVESALTEEAPPGVGLRR